MCNEITKVTTHFAGYSLATVFRMVAESPNFAGPGLLLRISWKSLGLKVLLLMLLL